MSLILHLETSTKVCSACLARDGVVLALKEVQEKNFSHSENLTLFVEAILSEANVKMKDIDAVAISEGPGSYTGLRIGTSTAKGICFALDIPLIVIPTLKIIANQYNPKNNQLIVPMIDARRMEVFYAVYNDELTLLKETKAEEITDSFLLEYTEKSVLFVGDGAFKMEKFLQEKWSFVPDSNISSSGMASLAYAKFKNKDFADTAYFEPFYLKDFIAGKPKKWF
jgi:tRNA threonylcarbamoyladenosine biosynthesis protein TsaB